MADTSEPPREVSHTCGNCGMTRDTLSGAWLKWFRLRNNVGLRELSRRSGISPAMLSDVESGNRHATQRVEIAYVTHARKHV